MDALQTGKKETIFIDMTRDECKLIERGGDDAQAAKRALANLHRVMKTMPTSPIDTVAEVRKGRRRASA